MNVMKEKTLKHLHKQKFFKDNCSDPSKCECQQLTIESHDRLSASLRVTQDKTYKYRTLTEKVISGIYECNDMCSCSKKLCYNRVVQQNIKIPLEVGCFILGYFRVFETCK